MSSHPKPIGKPGGGRALPRPRIYQVKRVEETNSSPKKGRGCRPKEDTGSRYGIKETVQSQEKKKKRARQSPAKDEPPWKDYAIFCEKGKISYYNQYARGGDAPAASNGKKGAPRLFQSVPQKRGKGKTGGSTRGRTVCPTSSGKGNSGAIGVNKKEANAIEACEKGREGLIRITTAHAEKGTLATGEKRKKRGILLIWPSNCMCMSSASTEEKSASGAARGKREKNGGGKTNTPSLSREKRGAL